MEGGGEVLCVLVTFDEICLDYGFVYDAYKSYVEAVNAIIIVFCSVIQEVFLTAEGQMLCRVYCFIIYA